MKSLRKVNWTKIATSHIVKYGYHRFVEMFAGLYDIAFIKEN